MNRARNETVAQIKALAQDMVGCDAQYVVLAILLDMGIPTNYIGFGYLLDAVLLRLENPELDLTNDIYNILAKNHSCGSDTASSAIRGALKAAWMRCDHAGWYRYLPTVPKDKTPTNAEVIAGLARIVELWQGCAKAYQRQLAKEVVSSGTE